MASLSAPMLFNLFSTGQYSDFTIICKDREFKVHKMVICPQSDFFRAVCTGNFQEQNSVTLQDSDPEIIAKVLHFLYFSYYHVGNENCTLAQHSEHRKAELSETTSESTQFIALELRDDCDLDWKVIDSPLTKVRVYIAADMLGILSLRRAEAHSIIDLICRRASSARLTLVLKAIYEQVPATDILLRSTMTNLCAVNYDRISGHPEVIEVLKDHQPFLWDMAERMGAAHKKLMETRIKRVIERFCNQRFCQYSCRTGGSSNLVISIDHDGIQVTANCKICSQSIKINVVGD